MRTRLLLLLVVTLTVAFGVSNLPKLRATSSPAIVGDSALPNDNRVAAGNMRGNVHRIQLEAAITRWRPDPDVDSLATVYAFREAGRPTQVPGPLIRVHEGTDVELTLHNKLDSVLVMHGLRGQAFATDTLSIAPDETRTIRFRASNAGTYLYWGTTTNASIDKRTFRDSQLTGAFIVDAAGQLADTAERIFVITAIDLYKGDTLRNKRDEDIWEITINGRSWPHTERFTIDVGDTVRWRWINGSYLPHPMHLHGFHFRVLSNGDNNVDHTFAEADIPMVVTQPMHAGSTFRMEWTPTRAGHWLMHCHMLPHITPFPERPDSLRAHDMHDVQSHALYAMAGLVIGIETVDRGPATTPDNISQRLRIFAQQSQEDSTRTPTRAFVLQHGAEPRADSVQLPSSLLLLRRGQTSAITVINRLQEPTTVHWHGMELESVYDGVSGWSRTGSSIAPLVAPGDSFTVVITPPRAGTFMYHTHMDEGGQLPTGMYGALIVLDSAETYDAEHDLVFIAGEVASGDSVAPALNGKTSLPVRTLRAGETYRLRFISLLPAERVHVRLVGEDSTLLEWRPRAKDGADLPTSLRAPRESQHRFLAVGEAYDYDFGPVRPMRAELQVQNLRTGIVISQPIRVAGRR